jgi:hypothetical protein
MDANGYAAFLLMGVLLVLIDGQVLYRSGLGYLQKVYEPEAARSVMQLVAVLFHLVVLGAVALISTIDVATGMPLQDLVVKLGVALLAIAAAHGFTMAILIRIRNRRRQEQLEDEIAADRAGARNIESTTFRPPGGPSSGSYSA